MASQMGTYLNTEANGQSQFYQTSIRRVYGGHGPKNPWLKIWEVIQNSDALPKHVSPNKQ